MPFQNNKPNKFILIHGFAGSGKSSFAELLSQRMVGAYILSLAEPLKEGMLNLFDVNSSALFGPSELREGQLNDKYTIREALQKLGDCVRDIDPDILAKRIAREPRSGVAIIPDVRYENELRVIRNYYSIRVPSTSALCVKITKEGTGPGEHPSEWGISDDQFDIVLDNNSTLEDLVNRFMSSEVYINWIKSLQGK
jgi:hypothetical protein